MAELRKWAASALLLAAAVAAAVFAPSAGSEQGVGGSNTRRMVCRARVLAVDDSGLQTLGHVQYGSQTLEVELLDGDRKGMRARAGNTVRGQMELDTIYRPGDVLLASAPSAELSENATPVLTALSPWRLAPTLAVFALFALLLVAFAGRTGLNALTSFVFCAFVVWRVVVPLALAGWNASLVAFVATGVMAAAIMALVGGFTRKAAVAFGGCMLGVAAGIGEQEGGRHRADGCAADAHRAHEEFAPGDERAVAGDLAGAGGDVHRQIHHGSAAGEDGGGEEEVGEVEVGGAGIDEGLDEREGRAVYAEHGTEDRKSVV